MKLSWLPDVPANIASLVPYPPGKPIEETKREFGIDEVIKLASNENPLGPSPLALQAIEKNLKELNLYPDGSHYKLKSALAKRHGVEMNELSVGNGSNEFIDLLIRIFVPRECNVVAPEKSFIAYKLCAQLQGCQYLESALKPRFEMDVDAILKTVNEKTKLVFLANPNNPTGAFVNAPDVQRLAAALNEKKILLVLDYAYWEYVNDENIPDPFEILKQNKNVIVLKTFSKAYGLAGLRVGYMAADAQIVSFVEKSRQPFNVGSLALEAATAALGDEGFVEKSFALNQMGMKLLREELSKFGLDVYASQGNFLLVDFKRPVQALYTEFLKRGVILRPVSNYGLPSFFRISIGTEAENRKLLQAMAAVLK